MIKKVLIFFCMILLLPGVYSLNLTVEKVSGDVISISNFKDPIKVKYNLTNNGEDNDFFIYNLLGFTVEPDEKISIKKGETKEIEMLIYPRENFNYEGYYLLKYSIRNLDDESEQYGVTINFVNLDNVFEIGTSEIDPNSNSIKLSLINKINYDFKNVKGEFYSDFFKFEEVFDINANEKKEFVVTLNKEDYKKLLAGFYTLEVDLDVNNKTTRLKGTIKFSEKDILTSVGREWGWFVNTKVITKTNEGNTPVPTSTEIKKNIVSRLFTSFSPKPDYYERDGFTITYIWNREINPGENSEIRVQTNWFFPFIIILLIILLTLIAKRYSLKPLQINKSLNFVRTVGGEFGLKVTIKLKARKDISNISLIDKIPPLMKLYSGMGISEMSNIDEKNRKVEWDFKSMANGEIRVVSYIIYSKMGVLGKFALPSAAALYELNGKVKEAYSNKAFFVSEQQVGAEKVEE